MEISKDIESAYQLALEAYNKAYAKYSNFHVGAALKVKGISDLVVGCNVENASYGATVCAERTAINASIAKHGNVGFEYIMVVTNTTPATLPCALCLQVIAEFCEGDFPIYLANLKGVERKLLFKELLTTPFSSIPQQD